MAGLGERIRDDIRGHWYGTTVLAIGSVGYLFYLVSADEPPSGFVVNLIIFVAILFGMLRFERRVLREPLPLWVEIVGLAGVVGIGVSLTILAGHPIDSLNVLVWPAVFVVGVALRGLSRLIHRTPAAPN